MSKTFNQILQNARINTIYPENKKHVPVTHEANVTKNKKILVTNVQPVQSVENNEQVFPERILVQHGIPCSRPSGQTWCFSQEDSNRPPGMAG